MVDDPASYFLDHDILVSRKTDSRAAEFVNRIRFLDYLWLPCAVNDLSHDQIITINRYREEQLKLDIQYKYATQTREVFGAVMQAVKPAALLEIGCGKFPLDGCCGQYFAVDIDPEAISHLRERGYTVCHPPDVKTIISGNLDFVISAYAMHFRVEDAFLALLTSISSEHAVFCFNIIVDDGISSLDLLSRLSNGWPLLQVLKTEHMARREFFFTMGRQDAGSRMMAAAEAIRKFGLK